MSNSLDPTWGARCCRERVHLRPFPTQGESTRLAYTNPSVHFAMQIRPTARCSCTAALAEEQNTRQIYSVLYQYKTYKNTLTLGAGFIG